ncbi:PKD domain-containing protein [Mangrovibacterium sp.]|uniref:PKD domain-containing protein n=1 Tax=Mangrovibacterium sp. TaxID=1961364 RepID=UPI003564815E
MRSRMLIFLIAVLTSGFSFAQSGTLSLELAGASSITFCKDSLAFGPMVKVEGDSIYDGLKVSIANYISGAERLECKKLSASLSAQWLSATGTLELRGAATAGEYQDAIENIWYFNPMPIPNSTTRQIAISLIDADFLPETGHFYRYYKQPGISWNEAKAAAESDDKIYHGMRGYLVTITMKEENEFIWTKIDGVGWIGASDEEREGYWKWVTGPEAGTLFWKGAVGGAAVSGQYANWRSDEPNNQGDEDYAHINQSKTNEPKTWNDLPNAGGSISADEYYPKGYIVEYGGRSDDPDLELSTSFDIKIRKVVFSAVADQTICRYDTISLNQSSEGSYSWLPTAGLSDAFISNPKASPYDSTVYQARVDYDGCVDTKLFNVNVTPVYSTAINIDSSQCSGYSLAVNYEGDAPSTADFSWYFADTLYAGGKGLTDLTIQLGFLQTNQRKLGLQISESGCQSVLETTQVRVTPNIELTADVTEGCRPLTVNFSATATEEIETYTWEFGDGLGLSTPDPSIQHVYDYAGAYDVTLTVFCVDGCTNTGTFDDFITVYPIKTVYTDIDPKRCYPHEFDVNYTGSGTDADTYLWDLSALDPEEIVYNPGNKIGPLRISLKNKPQASIGLQVISDKGCTSAKKTFSFKRQPWFDLAADIARGCSPFTANLTATALDPIDQLSYTWDTGLSTQTGEQVAEEYSEQGAQYQISAIGVSSITGCSDTVLMEQAIDVYSDPVAAFDFDKAESLISDPVFQFTNLSEGALNYEWDFGDGQFSYEENPKNRYEGLGWFDVLLLAESEFGCTDTVSHRVLVAPDDLFPPNAISPNSTNPENHIFLLTSEAVQTEGYHMLIYNRWGEQVFESIDKATGWDGKMKNGEFAPEGTYVWVLNYRDVFDHFRKQSGTVTLVF